MSEIIVLHNPRCSTSRAAVEAVEAGGLEAFVRNYLTSPLSRDEWLDVIAKLDGEPGDLVRRDPNFERSGLKDDEVATAEQVATVLAERPELAQRPVLIRGGRAIIGRPKSRVPAFLA
ncbi:arsenate reductase [Tessaracoccus aquimaris]|uniref:Arsenate reductase n=1 Tax=Tessaracoccus aquimaris TaxID=1332264 RepID=A0A1Q2CQ43_9ACTN|nr:ArsC/Spx/MgsR family protein [Tessaracoccus aquimaris]AQP48222.1 arsenate reductase [Tessaracoccus aquimaris]